VQASVSRKIYTISSSAVPKWNRTPKYPAAPALPERLPAPESKGLPAGAGLPPAVLTPLSAPLSGIVLLFGALSVLI